MKKIRLFICLLISFMMIGTVQAKDISHFHAEVDNDVKLEDNVAGSTVLAGSNASMTGKADGVSFVLGNKVEFKGKSEYGVFAGNSINVSGLINKDVFVFGNLIDIDKDASLKRDALIVGTDVVVKSDIGRNISIYASSISIKDSKIEGNVKLYATNIEIDDKTEIKGNLSYPEDASVKFSEESVAGKVIKTDAIESEDNTLASIMMGKFWSFLSLILVFAVLSLVASKLFVRVQNEYEKFDFNKGLELFTKGLLFLIFIPIIIFTLFLMSIGIPLALILLALYFIIIYLSNLFTGYLIGYKIWQKFFDKDINMLVVGIFGFAILFILNLIPGINFIVSILTMIIGIGIIYDVILKKIGSSD